MKAPPRKSLGQHFLTDRSAVARIVEALGVDGHHPVLEIGPGRGALTESLIDRAGRIHAVELDRALADDLEHRFGDALRLVRQDVLRVPLESIGPGPWLVVSNLPYNISKPFARSLVHQRNRVVRAVLMFQREVAERLLAPVGSADYGPLRILVGEAFRIERLFDVRPGGFWPPPKVHSTVTRWTPRRDSDLDDAAERRLCAALEVCFAARRKTLRNNLRARFGDPATVDRLLERAGSIDGGMRPERIEPAQFRALADCWPR